jgi:cytochrome c553
MKNILALSVALLTVCATAALAADAKENWEKQCAKCHGADGKGQTTMGKKLNVKDYTSADVQKKFTDEEAIKIMKDGKKEGDKTLMKGFAGTLSDDEIKALVKQVRSFAK